MVTITIAVFILDDGERFLKNGKKKQHNCHIFHTLSLTSLKD